MFAYTRLYWKREMLVSQVDPFDFDSDRQNRMLWRLIGYWHGKPLPTRIDALKALALAFIIWFGVIPLVRLL